MADIVKQLLDPVNGLAAAGGARHPRVCIAHSTGALVALQATLAGILAPDLLLLTADHGHMEISPETTMYVNLMCPALPAMLGEGVNPARLGVIGNGTEVAPCPSVVGRAAEALVRAEGAGVDRARGRALEQRLVVLGARRRRPRPTARWSSLSLLRTPSTLRLVTLAMSPGRKTTPARAAESAAR